MVTPCSPLPPPPARPIGPALRHTGRPPRRRGPERSPRPRRRGERPGRAGTPARGSPSRHGRGADTRRARPHAGHRGPGARARAGHRLADSRPRRRRARRAGSLLDRRGTGLGGRRHRRREQRARPLAADQCPLGADPGGPRLEPRRLSAAPDEPGRPPRLRAWHGGAVRRFTSPADVGGRAGRPAARRRLGPSERGRARGDGGVPSGVAPGRRAARHRARPGAPARRGQQGSRRA